MSVRQAAITALLLCLAACTCDVPPVPTYSCKSGEDCATGFQCLEGVCVQVGGTGGGLGTGGGSVTGGGIGGGGTTSCVGTSECPADAYCVQGTCTPRHMNGTQCSSGDECLTTFCTEGFCCESACSGGCDSCALSGTEGMCVPVPVGTPGAPACDPFLCDGVSAKCPTSCTDSSECVAPLFCDTSSTCSPSTVPRNLTAPSITADGGFVPGNPLTANDGTWGASTGGTITTQHRWLRCDDAGTSCVPLTATQAFTGTNLQTDATRTAGVQGDGLAIDSSVGTWVGSTNLVTNGGLENGANGWAPYTCCADAGLSAAVAQDTTTSRFGGASLAITTQGADVNEGGGLTVGGVTSSANVTASAWINAPTGATLCFQISELDSSGAFIQQFGQASTFTPAGAWQRVVRTATTSANTAQLSLLFATCDVNPQMVSFSVDGVQVEKTKTATPYIETASATAMRAASVLTGPSSLLDPSLGWIAFRARPEWKASAALQQSPPLLTLGASSTNMLAVSYGTSGGAYVLARNNGGTNTASQGAQVVPGSANTVVASWGHTGIGISVDGASFSSASASQIPSSLPATLALGPFDGELLWVAAGFGVLNDNDAAALAMQGDTDPSVAALPGLATMAWDAATLSYSVALTGSTYTPSAADLGSTIRLEVTAVNDNGVTTQVSAPVLIVPAPPRNLTAPTIGIANGGTYTGGVLSAFRGTWANAPTSFAYQWRRCDAMGSNCADATGMGATGTFYTVDTSDVGSTLRVQVTATNAGGSASATSSATAVIVNGAPVFRATGAPATFSGTSVTLNRPTGVMAGDLMLAFITWTGDPGTVTPPSGWTLAVSKTASTPSIAAYWAIAGANEPTTYAFGWSTAASGGGGTAAYSGAKNSTPIAASAVGNVISGSKTATLPGVTTTGAYQVEVGFSGATTQGLWPATVTGWTVRTRTFGSNPNGGFADRVIATAGATGSTNWTNTATGSPNTVNSLSLSVAISPP
jgi:hypothetical protein